MKLLIVDDSLVMQDAIEKYLSDYDLQVVGAAGNGKKALEMFDQHDPDVVTMDITMPEMDGVTCLEQMIQRKPETKIMIITALADKGTGLKALKKGARGYLHKPITPEKLKEAFDKLLKRTTDE
ncbi:MAG: response regulator [Calditrichaeota bacterium]|nr:response regulator [Calditrichota bacterium]